MNEETIDSYKEGMTCKERERIAVEEGWKDGIII
jgi:hypothetical protein